VNNIYISIGLKQREDIKLKPK